MAAPQWLRSYAPIFGALLFGVLAATLVHQRQVKQGEDNKAVCLGEALESQATLESHFFLNQKFSPQELTPSLTIELIQKHIRYIQTSLPHYDKSLAPRFVTLPFESSTVLNHKIEKTKYPFDLKLYTQSIRPYFLKMIEKRTDFDSLYLQNALARGKTSSNDPGIKISYQASLKIVHCDSQDQKLHPSTYLPMDPFLAFWFVPEANQVQKVNLALKADEKITPCASDDFIYDQDPYYYWHYWSLNSDPRCQKAHIQDSFQKFSLSSIETSPLKTSHPLKLDFLKNLQRPLKITVNLTMIDDDSPFVPELFDASLTARVEQIMTTQEFASAREQINQLEKYDISMRTGLAFSWALKEISDDFKFEQTALDEMLFQWTITGKFKKSQKPYQVEVTVGSAMKEMASYEAFYQALNKGLAQSDIVYFGGHSGTGKNLAKDRIYEQTLGHFSELEATQAPAQQIVFLMTCYALRYFPTDAFPNLHPEFVRDILYTASLPGGYDSRLLLGMLEQIDQTLAGHQHLPLQQWLSKYKTDIFLYHRHLKAGIEQQ